MGSSSSTSKSTTQHKNAPQIKHKPTPKEDVQLAEAAATKSTVTPPVFTHVLTGLESAQPPPWLLVYWSYLHEFATESLTPETTQFFHDLINTKKKWAKQDVANIDDAKEQDKYKQDMNAIYDKYIHYDYQNDPDKPVINVEGKNKIALDAIRQREWKDNTSTHLLSIQQIWGDIEKNLSTRFNRDIYMSFRHSLQYKRWEEEHGNDYVEWSKSQHSAYGDYFNELNDMEYQQAFIAPDQGLNNYYLPHHQMFGYPYHHNGELYDRYTDNYHYYNNNIMNMELMVLVGIMTFIVMTVCCLCGLFIVFFCGYLHCFKSGEKKQLEVIEYSDNL